MSLSDILVDLALTIVQNVCFLIPKGFLKLHITHFYRFLCVIYTLSFLHYYIAWPAKDARNNIFISRQVLYAWPVHWEYYFN